MKLDLQKALENTDAVYKELIEIANGITKQYTSGVDSLIQTIQNSQNLSNDAIRDYMFKLSVQSFQFSETKEKSSLKAVIAESLRKEAYAIEFNSGEGSVAAKDNNAQLKISNEIMVEAVYDLISGLLKTKLDECHRFIDVLKTVLTTRLQEAKLNTNTTIGE